MAAREQPRQVEAKTRHVLSRLKCAETSRLQHHLFSRSMNTDIGTFFRNSRRFNSAWIISPIPATANPVAIIGEKCPETSAPATVGAAHLSKSRSIALHSALASL